VLSVLYPTDTNYPADLDGRVYLQFLPPETAGRIKITAVADAFPSIPIWDWIEVKRGGLARTHFASGTIWAETRVQETNGPQHLPWEGYGTRETNTRLQQVEREYFRLLSHSGAQLA